MRYPPYSLCHNKVETPEEDNVREDRLRSLEERVVVLERLATDKSSRLKEEIDALKQAIKSEFEQTMAYIGCRRVSELNRDVFAPKSLARLLA